MRKEIPIPKGNIANLNLGGSPVTSSSSPIGMFTEFSLYDDSELLKNIFNRFNTKDFPEDSVTGKPRPLECFEREFFIEIDDDGGLTRGYLPEGPIANGIVDPFQARGIYGLNLVRLNGSDRELFGVNSKTGLSVQIVSRVRRTEGILPGVQVKQPPLEVRQTQREPEEFVTEYGRGIKGIIPFIDPIILQKKLGLKYKNVEDIPVREFIAKANQYLLEETKRTGERASLDISANQLSTTESVVTLKRPWQAYLQMLKKKGKPRQIIRAHTHFEFLKMSAEEEAMFDSMRKLDLRNDPQDLINLADTGSFLGTATRLASYGLMADDITFPAFGIQRVDKEGFILGEPHLLVVKDWSLDSMRKMRVYRSRAEQELSYAMAEQGGDVQGLENFRILIKTIDDYTYGASEIKISVNSNS